ncbi:MAG: hypothetical protein WCG73_00980 [Candidatus Moraniibacteriota bacterium]
MNILEMFNRRPMKIAEGEKSSGGSASQDSPVEGTITLTDGHKENPVVLENESVLEKPPLSEEVLAIKEVEPLLTPAEAAVKEKEFKKSVRPKKTKKSTTKTAKGSKNEVSASGTPKELVAKPIVTLEKNEIPKEILPQKGDVFQAGANGDRIVVDGVEKRDGVWGVLYSETSPSGKLKKGGKIFWKVPKSFNVMVDSKEMQKNDPLKESQPEFYAIYNEQMEKVVSAFLREFEASCKMIDAWGDYIEKGYGVFLRDEKKEKGKKKEAEDVLKQFQFIEEEVEKLGKTWNALDMSKVDQGRQGIRLLTEIRALEKQLPDFALELKHSGLELLKEKDGADEPDVELVEKEYQKILLNRKVEEVKKKYDQFVDGNTVTAQDMPELNDFANQINDLFDLVVDSSSSEDIKKVLTEIESIEEQMFARKKEQGDGNGMGENGFVGGFVKRKNKTRKENGNGHGKKGNLGNQRFTRSKGRIGTDEEESLVSSGAILQAEQGGQVISQEQRQTAFKTMQKIDKMIREKKRLATSVFEDSANIGEISKGKYKSHIGLLNDLGRDAEDFLANVKIAGLQSILEKIKGVEFKGEELAVSQKDIEVPVVPVSEKPKERTYEELEKTLLKIKRNSCVRVIKKGLIPYEEELAGGQAEYPDLTLKNIVDYYGIDAVVKSFSPAVEKLLPSEWNEAERNLFTQGFVKREIISRYK